MGCDVGLYPRERSSSGVIRRTVVDNENFPAEVRITCNEEVNCLGEHCREAQRLIVGRDDNGEVNRVVPTGKSRLDRGVVEVVRGVG